MISDHHGATGSSASDRLPPQNLEAERGVIGSVLIDADVLHEVVAVLPRPGMFYRDGHATIWHAVLEMVKAGAAVDSVTLMDELERRGDLERAGGIRAVGECAESVPHSANAKYYADIVRQKYVSRRLIEAANEMLKAGYSNQFTSPELLEAAEKRIFQIADEQVSARLSPMSEVVEASMGLIVGRAEGASHGLATGFPDLDDLLGGLQPEYLVIVAARPSMGKTAFGQGLLEHVSVLHKEPSLLVSLEMSREQIGERGLVSMSRVCGHKVRTGQPLDGREMRKLSKAYDALHAAPIWVDDTPSQGMLQIMSTARRLKAQHGLGVVVVDYIQLVDSEDNRSSRQEQVSQISRRLKVLARELRVPVIALSQLNRKAEDREDKRPKMSDLRESGAIEQDADIVLLLHRPEYYDPNDQPGLAEVIVAKNRHGATGSAKLVFLKNYGAFANVEMHPETPNF